MVMSNRTERLLLDDLRDLGYEGVKVDVRTGQHRRDHDAGDIIAGRPLSNVGEVIDPAEMYVIEEKYKNGESRKHADVDADKLAAMIEFAEAIGATPVVACRWSTNLDWSPGAAHYCTDARELDLDGVDSRSIHPDRARQEFEPMEVFFG